MESMMHELALEQGESDTGFRGIAIDTCLICPTGVRPKGGEKVRAKPKGVQAV
jgi:hypothetical protein